MKKKVHQEKYVYFKKKSQVEDSKVVHKKEFYDILLSLKGYTQIEHTTDKKLFLPNCFALTERGQYLRLTWNDGSFHQRYTNFKDDKRNDRERTQALREVMNKFGKRTKVKFRDAFGITDQSYKRCVPGLFHYDNFLPGIELNICKLDYSSHFPSCATGSLPDANTSITVEGYQEPTEEYPFAFYPNNGFVAEYGKYNSWDWWNTQYQEALFMSPERTYRIDHNAKVTTVLMKASKYNIDSEMNEFYNIKQSFPKGSPERDKAKVILLKVIGQMEMNDKNSYSNHPYAHLAAIIKARAIWKMLQLIDRIGEDNVLSIIVDGILFKNDEGIHYGDKTEFLGSLEEEYFQAFARLKGHNQFVLKEQGKCCIAHAGYDINTDQEDISLWQKSPSVHLKEVITEELKLTIEDLNYG